MNTNPLNDKIDRELTKIYFGNSNKKNSSKKHPSSGGNVKKTVVLAISIIIVMGIVGSGAYLFYNKKSSPNTTTNEKKTTDKGTASTVGSSRKSSPIKPIKNEPIKKVTIVTSQQESKEKSIQVLYDFENNEDGWGIPGWALEKQDYVATSITQGQNQSTSGKGSLEFHTEFPKGVWTAALVEIPQFIDLSKADSISVDIFIPENAPVGLKAKMILTVKDTWQFIEMSLGYRLISGKWNTITADLSDGSIDWRTSFVDNSFRSDIRKIAVRIESDGIPYSGPVHIDNMRYSY